MNVPPVSVERVQKCVVNFEIYRFLKKRPIYPILPYRVGQRNPEKRMMIYQICILEIKSKLNIL